MFYIIRIYSYATHFLLVYEPKYICSNKSLSVFLLLQSVVGHVRMEGCSMAQPVLATVHMATVGLPVEVSALLGS